MQTTTRSSRLIHHTLTLLFGAALAAGIWLVGYAELSWLGFASAAMHAETPSGRRALSRLSRRSRS
jgi:hypothetical protein